MRSVNLVLRWVLLGVLLMARGLPDAGNVVKEHGLVSLDDMAELAVRLGSPVRYHRGGDVVFIDGFEFGLQRWELSLFAPDSSITLRSDRSLTGGVSVDCDSGVGAPRTCKMVAYTAPLVSDLLGVHWAFSIGVVSESIHFDFIMYGENTQVIFRVIYDKPTGMLQIRDHDGNPQDVGSVGELTANNYYYHHIKMVVNQETDSYVRIVLDNVNYDVSMFKGERIAPPSSPRVDIAVRLEGNALEHTEVWIDDVVVTMNEQ